MGHPDVDRLVRRERELSALMASIRELAQVRDVQPLLQKLVDRAHELIGTDLTYLSEYDEATDELFVRATNGAVSPHMLGLRVPAGVGLASQVVQSRSARWTSEYDVDVHLRDTEVTQAVAAEAMRSILGVPLVSSDRVLGVLFAADRSQQTFSPDQIALLTAFADHGAVIVQTARLLASERANAARAASATEEAESRAAAMEAAASFHERLTELVLTREPPEAIAAELSVAIGQPVALADRQLQSWATAGDAARSWWRRGRLPAQVVQAIQQGTRTARWVPVEGPGPEGVVASMAGSTLLGAILVGGPLDEVRQRTVERASQIHALLTMQRDAVADAEERVRGELVADLVSGRGDLAAMESRAAQRDIDLDRPWTPAFAAGWGSERWGLTRTLAAQNPRWLVGQHEAGVLVLAQDDPDPQQLGDEVHRRLGRETVGSLVVVGRPTRGGALPDEVKDLTALSRLLGGLGIAGRAVCAQDYAPYLALFGSDGERARAYAERLLRPLRDWDRTHASSLADTLAAYLAHQSSVTRAAGELVVHPNTVKQRLGRITELLGPRWREPDHQFRLRIATELARMSEMAILER